MTRDRKKPLAEWAGWRGAIDINRHIAAGMAVEWEGKLWCGSESDRQTLLALQDADLAAAKARASPGAQPK